MAVVTPFLDRSHLAVLLLKPPCSELMELAPKNAVPFIVDHFFQLKKIILGKTTGNAWV